MIDWLNLEGNRLVTVYPEHGHPATWGIFSPSLDRFILVDKFDLATTLHSAKLLSSKMSLIVFVLPRENYLSNENCLHWSLNEKSTILLSEIEGPILRHLPEQNILVEQGLPINMSREDLRSDQNFAFFVWRAVCAMRLTDAYLNSLDHTFYLKLFPLTEQSATFQSSHDYTKWPTGFVTAIEQVLYFSQSVDEALAKLGEILPYPQNIDLRHEKAISRYAREFYQLLGWRPSVSA